MARIFRNKTASEARVTCRAQSVIIPANDEADLSASFTASDLASSESLILLLGQGTDKYQLNDGTRDLSVEEALRLVMALAPAQGPTQTDGSPYVSPCMFPSGVYLYITGAGDGAGLGDGAAFSLESEAAGDTTKEFSFADWVLMAGGASFTKGAVIGDWASFEVYCPATPVTPNGSNIGNCNVVTGIIVPAAGNGAYDVDLVAANPILTPAKDGYWEWSFPDTGKGTVTAGSPGKAGAHLLAVDQSIIRFANRIPLLDEGERNFTIPAIEPKVMLPHWKGKVTLYNAGHTGLKMAWHLLLARRRTV